MRCFSIPMVIAGLAAWLPAQPPGPAGKAWDNVKAENGAVVFWKLNSVPGQPQVHVQSSTGKALFSLDILPQIPGAAAVSIPDVSRGKSGRLAISAVAVKADGTLAAALLVYDPDGRLRNLRIVSPMREIRALAVDDDDSIWTLCDNGGDYLAHYDATGADLGSMVPRSALPELPEGVEGDLRDGATAFGLSGSKVWFYAAPTRTLMSVEKNGAGLGGATVSIGSRVLGAVALADGRFAVQALSGGEKPALALYLRDPATGTWQADPRGATGRLIGAEGGKLAFLERNEAIIWR